MPHRLSRRDFLHTAGAALSAGVLFADRKPPASERLQVGVIGVAGQGGGDMSNVAAAGAEIVALCDVDESRAGNGPRALPQGQVLPRLPQADRRRGLDAVLVATPDHIHAMATLAALRPACTSSARSR